MNLIEFNDKLLVNKDRKKCSVQNITQEECDAFRQLTAASHAMGDLYGQIDDSTAFYKAYGQVAKIFGRSAEDLFYACKMGYFYEGIPARLSYILRKAFAEAGATHHVNDTLNRCYHLLERYLDDIYEVDGEEFTLKDVIDNFAGAPVKLLTSSVRKVKTIDCSEVYVPNVARVALLPSDIANMLPYAECEKISFSKDMGLMIGEDIVVRCLNERIGVTRDDFDLRECV